MGRGKCKKNISNESQNLGKVAKRPGQGVRLNSQAKAIIENVRQFFNKESRYGYSINTRNPAVRTAKATGVSRRSVL